MPVRDVSALRSQPSDGAAEARPLRIRDLPAGASFAAIASGAMIAHQVAGKAVRDALFLSSFHVRSLPAMMAASALLSLAAVVAISRLMVRYSPAKVVPVGFGLGAVTLLVEWGLDFASPRVAAVALYLYTAVFGAAMISAFWSLINETFDPHTAKRAVASIAAGGTLGGVLGGVLGWRASAWISVPTMLPVLSVLCAVSLWGTTQLVRSTRATARREAGDDLDGPVLAPLRVLRDAPYLRNLAWVVAFGAVTSGLLDYVFSAEAVDRYRDGRALLAFFSLFWLGVGTVSFALQILFGRMALEKLGLAVTLALLPGVVVLGGALGLAVPGLWSAAILRGGEATQRNSLFRAAYELLYTPLSEQKKRATKTLIDVGFDRFGTVAASGITALTLALTRTHAEMTLLLVAVACALATIARSRPLHRGYVAVLEESLREKSVEAGRPPDAIAARASMESPELRDAVVQHLDALPPTEVIAAALKQEAVPVPMPRPADGRAPGEAIESLAEARDAAIELHSGEPARVRRVLASDAPLSRATSALVVVLLADDEFHVDAIRSLRRAGPGIAGMLIDALCDPHEDFHVRRRIPRVLSEFATERAAEGLLRGAEDERFEVRYACGRALLKLRGAHDGILVPLARVVSLIEREVRLSRDIWETQGAAAVDEQEYETPALFERLLRDRVDRSLEHVFNLLALHLDTASLQIAFDALHQEDPALRGTALEYLENVLPDEIRDALWPFLGEERPMRPLRPTREILADLVRHHDDVASTRVPATGE